MTPNDAQALAEARALLDNLDAGTTTRQPIRDGELAHMTPAERRAELARRYRRMPGDDAA